jgi:hypothetical protein
LDKIGFLDEVEKIWGSRWGGSGGIGLARSRLIRPTEHELDPLWEHELDPLWEEDGNFFLLRRVSIDIDRLKEAFEDLSLTLTLTGDTQANEKIKRRDGPL